jgi:electron transport complex protein RnfB
VGIDPLRCNDRVIYALDYFWGLFAYKHLSYHKTSGQPILQISSWPLYLIEDIYHLRSLLSSAMLYTVRIYKEENMQSDPYRLLAQRLDSLPNGFPPSPDGLELKLLAKLFTPQEAELAAQLRLTLENSRQISERIGGDPQEVRDMLKSMARRGLINAGRVDGGLGYGLLPFVVGIYELQVSSIDADLAQLFEQYYQQTFGQVLKIEPAVHRVIPVRESVQVDMEIRPFESAVDIVNNAQAWGVLECICRKQKALIGDPCDHPLEVCMTLSQKPGVFDQSSYIRALTRDEALATLQIAAEAGLVHTVSNNQHGDSYICNCCTCSCGILRGISELGIANAVAHSAFINHVNEELCIGCEDCLEFCQFEALTMDIVAQVDQLRCVGCGVCVQACPEGALSLARRPEQELVPVPLSKSEWMQQRAFARGIDIQEVL